MATIADQRKGATAGPPKPIRNGSGDAKGSPEAAEPGGRGRRKLLVIVLLAVVLIAAAGGGAYFMFLKKPGPPAPPVGGAMVQMDPQTLSLADGHFLKIQIAIQLTQGKATAATFQTVQAAQILIDTFSNRPVAELTTNPARKSLTAQLLSALKKAYPGEVFDVYLTQFVIQ